MNIESPVCKQRKRLGEFAYQDSTVCWVVGMDPKSKSFISFLWKLSFKYSEPSSISKKHHIYFLCKDCKPSRKWYAGYGENCPWYPQIVGRNFRFLTSLLFPSLPCFSHYRMFHSPSSAWLGSHGLLWLAPWLEPWVWVNATKQGSQLQLQATEVQKYQTRQGSEKTAQHELCRGPPHNGRGKYD